MTLKDLRKNNWKIKLLGTNLIAPCYLATFLVDKYEAKKGSLKLYIYLKSKNKHQYVYRYEDADSSIPIDANSIYIPILKINLTKKFKYADFKMNILNTLNKEISVNNTRIQTAKRDISNAKKSTILCKKMLASI